MKTVLIPILFTLALHPVHVSVTGIEFDADRKMFNLFVRVFSDDMEKDMSVGNKNSGIVFTGDDAGFQEWLSNRITISADGIPLRLKLVKVENDGLEHRFVLETKKLKRPATFVVSNTINMRIYSDQANMVMFKYLEKDEGFRLTANDTLKVINVN